jgi:glutaredoxin-like protein
MSTNNETITIYGTTWCGDCKRTRAFLDRNQIVYQFVDIDRDPEGRAYVEKVNHGCRSVPTILFPNGDLLVEPSTSQLVTRFGVPVSQN